MKQVGLTPEAHALLEALQREGETFSDVVVRVVHEWQVLQRFMGVVPEAMPAPVEEAPDADQPSS